eukprot:874451-Amphidinium_carterae.1
MDLFLNVLQGNHRTPVSTTFYHRIKVYFKKSHTTENHLTRKSLLWCDIWCGIWGGLSWLKHRQKHKLSLDEGVILCVLRNQQCKTFSSSEFLQAGTDSELPATAAAPALQADASTVAGLEAC